jgi:rare lipoprotein A
MRCLWGCWLMLLKNKTLLSLSVVSLILSGMAEPALARSKSQPISAPSSPTPEVVQIGEPYTIAGQRFEPRDDNTFDETGYAIFAGADQAGQVTRSGETYNPEAIIAAHRTLPVPSYAEVTDLQTGRTILVRIVDRGPMLKDKVIALSPGAVRQLGVEGQNSVAVRVRRTNPVEQEKAILRSGGAAPTRLDTPPALLSALRRRLGETSGKPVDLAVAPPIRPAPVRQPPVARKPPPVRQPEVVRPAPVVSAGADYDPPAAPVRVAAPPPIRRTTPPVARGNDRFTVEEAGKPHWIEGAGARDEAPRTAPVTAKSLPTPAKVNAPFFVQIASFSSESRAQVMARQAGASVVRAGNLFRVRKGPYADVASARVALGQVVAKGYRGARVTH